MLSVTIKRSLVLAAAVAPLAALHVQSASALPNYLDVNGTAAGSGVTAGALINLDNTSPNFDLDPNGLGAATTLATTDDAVIAAGTDAAGVAFTLAQNNVVTTAATATFEEGNVTLTATGTTGSLSVAGNTTINAGARVNLASFTTTSGGSARLSGTGNVVLDGGSLFNTSTINAGSFIAATKGLQITANGGTIGVDDGVANVIGGGLVQLYTGTITGTGGTTTTGVGTLIKDGADEFRYQAPAAGGTNTANTTFAKLLVNGGLYRLGSVLLGTPAVQNTSELGFGAAPAAPTADAITLNGGAIGASFSLTLNANRGITIGANGGTLFGSGGGTITLPGSLSGSGQLIVSGNSGGLVLNNAGNVTTFTGSVQVNAGTSTTAGAATALTLERRV